MSRDIVHGINVPSPITLAKYGLSRNEWVAMLEEQGGVCAVCKRKPPSGRMTTDHEHVPSWKKREPGERKIFVRGLLCWTCNHYALARGMSVERAENVATYLRAYAARRDAALSLAQKMQRAA